MAYAWWLVTASVLALLPVPAHASGDRLFFGESEPMGRGEVRSFVELSWSGRPERIGVVFDRRFLQDLPAHANTYSRCYDLDQDGSIEAGECHGDYEVILFMPDEIAARADIPFKWISVNWNPHGHVPPAPPQWAQPHFDFHFYVQPLEQVLAIRTGPCGELIHCDDFVRATTPVPAPFLPANHVSVDAAVAAMGNHLINTRSPELLDPSVPFTHTWIYGAYDGRVTFYEPMITRAYLESRPSVCTPLNLPRAWAESGWYPTEYCIRSKGLVQTVTLEKLVYRVAPRVEH